MIDKRKIVEEFLSKSKGSSVNNCDNKKELSRNVSQDIAIIGISGFFPNCMSIDEFFVALDEDKVLISEAKEKREVFNDYHGYAGLIPNVSGFDNEFFGYLPGEACLLDPQFRLLLMSVYHSIEDAGYSTSGLKGSSTGVFIASEYSEYIDLLEKNNKNLLNPFQKSQAMLANGISHAFDFHGASESINAMCASGALALHKASQAIKVGELDQAIVGAANIMLLTSSFKALEDYNQLSKTNTVYSFGDRSDGYLRGEAVCSVFLKSLAKAEKDGDNIYAVIKNSATNYNGKGGSSISSPDIASHCEVIENCYRSANIDIRDVRYIELQGMGHALTDLVEWEACNRSLTKIAEEQNVVYPDGACGVGTLKPMTGHLHAASALVALLKVIRSFKTNKIHKIINFKKPHPSLELKGVPCRLAEKTDIFSTSLSQKMAGIHSYGAGGSNVHLLLADYVHSPRSETCQMDMYFPFSAKNELSLLKLLEKFRLFLTDEDSANLVDIAYTLQLGRDSFPFRVLFKSGTKHDLIKQLSDSIERGIAQTNLEIKQFLQSSNLNLHKQMLEWLLGENMDWGKLYNSVLLKRAHLPTYPFDLERSYWYSQDENAAKKIGFSRVPFDRWQIENIIREILADFLQADKLKIDLQKEFSELGFNSLLVLNFAHKLREKFNIEIDTSLLFSVKTPDQLIQFMDSKASNVIPREFLLTAVDRFRENNCEIAIVGVAGSFPQAENIDQLWENIFQGLDCITQIPKNRWSSDDFYHPDVEAAIATGCYYSKAGGFLDQIDMFDPLFFHITPKEAEFMHPKERLFMRCAWQALEDAAYSPELLKTEKVGVFVGVSKAGLDNYKDSYFSIANRFSYFCDFKGPSLAIDTACSSSLTALHEACLHLKSNSCSFALVGAVNVYTHPSAFVEFSRLKVMSPDGKTRAFGDKANGFVPGEGVSVLALKPLARAIKDRDNIYGVIMGSAINHGGKTNGYTVPNPEAHSALIHEALIRSNISPEEISYVEAHGTGTPLGDPIEIRGLNSVFNQSASLATCKIGSIKSNIGHLEAAAGFAGITKVLLQMKHNWIAPTLHVSDENPEIHFQNSHFVLAKEGSQWEAKASQEKVACVSSFGAGGSNGHVIIKSYVDLESSRENNQNRKCIFIISAKNRSRLIELAKNLIHFFKKHENINIVDASYSLQVGRRSMPSRLAFIASSVDEVISKLKGVLENVASKEHYFFEANNGEQDILNLLNGASDFKSFFLENLAHRDEDSIARLWAAGMDVDWNSLYRDWPIKPKRISMPTYPFERFYLPLTVNDANHFFNFNDNFYLHKTVFREKDYFVASHVISGRKVMPGVAYIAHIQALAAKSIRAKTDVFSSCQIKDLAWLEPMYLESEFLEVLTEFRKNGDYFLFKVSHFDGFKMKVFCEGALSFSVNPEINNTKFFNYLNTKKIAKTIFREDCYHAFSEMGIDYGPAFKGIEQIDVVGNEDGKPYVVGRIVNPHSEGCDKYGYFIEPALLDSAFQALLGFTYNQEDRIPLVPFRLRDIQILRPISQRCTAILIHSTSLSELEVDIGLFTDSGELCIVIRGLLSRPLSLPRIRSKEVYCYQRNWESIDEDILLESRSSFIYLIGFPEVTLSNFYDHEHIDLESKNLDEAFSKILRTLFEKIKTIFQHKSNEDFFLQIVAPDTQNYFFLEHLVGFFSTASSENPRFRAQILLVRAQDSFEDIVLKVEYGKKRSHHKLINFSASKISREAWKVVNRGGQGGMPWRNGASYLISGGVGGIAQFFIQDILSSSKSVTLYLIGRSSREYPGFEAKNLMRKNANRIIYIQSDITDAQNLKEQLEAVDCDLLSIAGVLHLAGINMDDYILNKDWSSFYKVCLPKVKGALILDELTAKAQLEFFVMFSSISSVIGHPGQSDYAAANGFMDGFSNYRATLVQKGIRRGKTLAINWPYWLEGGMKISEDLINLFTQETGFYPITAKEGMLAFYEMIQSPGGQYLIARGEVGNINQKLNYQEPKKFQTYALVSDEVEIILIRALAKVANLQPHMINKMTSFGEYGLDSLMMTEMIRELELHFGPLSKTLLFQYQNIRDLVTHFETNFSKPPVPRNETVPMFSSNPGMDIAIVGISGKYPKAQNVQELWENLELARDCITIISPERWDDSKSRGKWGGFIDGVGEFDPIFFGISPREAMIMTPQERLFLQSAYEAIEDSGYTPKLIAENKSAWGALNKVGVFVGVMYEEYQLIALESSLKGKPVVVSNSFAAIANRVSYFCNFNGPSIAIDTMCSGSLTAINLACQSILSGESHVAIAGGVNVSIHPAKYWMLQQGKLASKDGKCRSFSADGTGYVPSEGVGAVILKPLSKAVLDGDHIYGVIKAVGINHGGRSNGFTVPNPNAQAGLIKEILDKSGVSPEEIDYIEAHGTGTPLGDPIEVKSLAQAFGLGPSKKIPIGSVKSNIGHCESAAGIAGLTKVLLQMKHKQLVPSIHAENLNPDIEFEHTPFFVQRERSPWIKGHGALTAGVSSFGAGGSNAFLIVQEYRDEAERKNMRLQNDESYLFIISALKEKQLYKSVEGLLKSIEYHQYQDHHLPEISYTLQVGRLMLKERAIFIANTINMLKIQLANYLANNNQDKNVIIADFEKIDRVYPSFEKNDAHELCQRWIAGADIDWVKFYQNQNHMRCALNTYPFENKVYWVPGQEAEIKIDKTTIRLRDLNEYQSEFPGEHLGEPIQNLDTESVLSEIEKPKIINQSENKNLELIREFLISSLAKELYMDESDIFLDKDFIEMGLDSVVGLEWLSKINENFKTNMLVTMIYKYSNIVKLSDYLYEILESNPQNENKDFDEILRKVRDKQMDVFSASNLLSNLIPTDVGQGEG